MGLVLNLSLLGMVVAFLVGVLVAFPGAGHEREAATDGPVDDDFNVERVHEAAGLFAGSYRAVVDEIISFQQDPDLQRAESRRREMVHYGRHVMERLDILEGRLSERLDQLEIHKLANIE